jgi:hypothetical protein
MFTNPHKKSSAFTLVDLGILILVFAVIAGFILPMFARSHNHGGSRKMKCKNNLRQLGTGMIQYIDHGGELGRRFTQLGTIDSGLFYDRKRPAVSYAGRDGRMGALVVDKMPPNTLMMCDDSEDTPNHDDA